MAATNTFQEKLGVNTFLGRLRAWQERRRLTLELTRIPDSEAARVFKDCGLQRQDGEYLTLDPQAPRTLLPAMLERYGLEADAVTAEHGAVMRDLQRVCGSCPSKRRCRKALASDASAAECARFCFNHVTLEALGSARAGG